MKGARTITERAAARKAFLSFTNRCFSFIIIIFGAAAIGDLSEWLNVGNPAVFAAVATQPRHCNSFSILEVAPHCTTICSDAITGCGHR